MFISSRLGSAPRRAALPSGRWWQIFQGVVLAAIAGGGVGAGDGCSWQAPVDAPIVDEFRSPSDPFGPGGNRGIEYGTEVGQAVSAVDDGQVDFAGPVGGRHWLVLRHDNGLRSTYGPLVGSFVIRGQTVIGGTQIAEADMGLHLTARAGDRYLDPAPLLAGGCGWPRLVNPGEESSSPRG